MSDSYSYEMRRLHLLQELWERTDEKHKLSLSELKQALAGWGLSADRKTIYRDIEVLRNAGCDIIYCPVKKKGYYWNSRLFEQAELKLLIDSVQASGSISERKTRLLIQKLCMHASIYERRELTRDIFAIERVKSPNESLFYNTDAALRAINEDRQLKFENLNWNKSMELEREGGGPITVSPWAMTWANGRYYIIAYDQSDKEMKYYSVDRMRNAEIVPNHRLGREAFAEFDVGKLAKRSFYMQGERFEEVMFECEEGSLERIIDRFGRDVIIVPMNDGHYRVRVGVCVGERFYGWVMSFGGAVRIEWPEHVKKDFRKELGKFL